MAAFLAVVEHGSFGAAAEALSVTQPALTKQIQALERAVGTRLLDRGRRGAIPTAAGLALIPRAQWMVSVVEDFWGHARRLGSGEAGSVSVGFGMSGLRQVPAVVRRFRELCPGIQVSIEDLPSDTQQKWVADGRLDVGFGREPSIPDVAFVPAWSDQLALATTDVDLDVGDMASWIDERAVIRLASAKGPGLTAHIDRLERHWRVHPTTLTTTHDLLTVIAMAQAGIGPAIIPYSARHLAQEPLRVIPIGEPVARWAVGPVWRPASVSPAARRLITLATEMGVATG